MLLKLFCLTGFYVAVLLYAFQANAQKILEENFKDNSKLWFVADNEDGSAEVKKGAYYIACRKDKRSYSPEFPTVGYTANSDFTIMFDTKWISGIENNGYGFTWGNRTDNKYGCFYITANGNFEVLNKGAVNEQIKPWTKSAAININGENKIKIVCKNRHYDFYINDLNVYSATINIESGKDFYFRVNDPQIVSFDNVRLEQGAPVAATQQTTQTTTTLAATEKAKTNLTGCDTKNRNADELMYDRGTMSDAAILQLPPEKQLLDYYNKNGVCIKINPLWVKHKSNTSGSFISISSDKLETVKSTFPFQLYKLKNPSILISIANNDETIEYNRVRFQKNVQDDLQRYLSALGKELTPADWQNKWQNLLIKEENFVTGAGENATLLIYNSVSVGYVNTNTKEADVTSRYYLRLMVPQPDKKLLQCSIEFSTTLYYQKTIQTDPLELKFFTPADEQKCLAFFKAMFKTITAAK